MRMRSSIAIALLLLPGALSAQLLPTRGGRGPLRPVPMPEPAPAIARELSYVRMPFAIESYPMVSFYESTGFAAQGAITSWSSLGMGTRADYRLTSFLSGTLDMTASLFGGPAYTQTLELGTRLGAARSERRAYPFLDLRVGYVHTFDSYFRPSPFADPFSPLFSSSPGARYSQGLGTIAGAGMEYTLSRSFSLTAGGTMMRANMTTYGFDGARPATGRYTLTAYRLSLGVRFNPVRMASRGVR